MVTLPPEPEGAAAAGTGGYDRAQASHLQRQVAEGFGADADRYDRARPTYPADLVDRIIAASPGRDVLDVGCGTGISARLFQAAGCRVLGVDPDPRMAGLARQGGTEVEVAKFEDWDSAGRVFDAVIAAQAWHWVDPVAGATKAADVLRADGRLALFWNVMSFPPDFAAGFSAAYRRVLPEFPFFQNGAPGGLASYAPLFDKAIDGIRQAGAFSEPEQWQFDWEQAYSRAEWLEQVPTFGGHSQLPAEKLAELLTGIGEVIDAAGGSFTMGYVAVVVTATRAEAG